MKWPFDDPEQLPTSPIHLPSRHVRLHVSSVALHRSTACCCDGVWCWRSEWWGDWSSHMSPVRRTSEQPVTETAGRMITIETKTRRSYIAASTVLSFNAHHIKTLAMDKEPEDIRANLSVCLSVRPSIWLANDRKSRLWPRPIWR